MERMITGKTRCVGLIGDPVEYSLSPLLQNAAFSAGGLDYVYVALPVREGAAGAAVQGLKALGFAGANVTKPHKLAVMPFLDRLDRDAQMIGAVNTIVVRGGQSVGYNTDAAGFVRSLRNSGVAVKGRRAVVLGAGGAARAVVWGLIGAGVCEISVGARSAAKAAKLAALYAPFARISAFTWDTAAFHEPLRACDLLINATPVGMPPDVQATPPLDWELLPPSAAVCDLIYSPRETRFLKQARQYGRRAINGEGMLVEQGAAAFALWTGRPADAAAMYEAMRRAGRSGE